MPKKEGKKVRVKATKAAKQMELHESEEEDVVLPQLGSKRSSRTVINYALPDYTPKLKKGKRNQTANDLDDFVNDDDTDDFIDDDNSLNEDIARRAQRPRKSKRIVNHDSHAPPAKKAREPKQQKPKDNIHNVGMEHSTLLYESAASNECQAAIMGDQMVQIRLLNAPRSASSSYLPSTLRN